MIKKFRVTVDGRAYEVTVEMPDEPAAAPQAMPPAGTVAPVPPPAPKLAAPAVSAPPPASKPTSGGPAIAGSVSSPLAGRITAVVVSVGQEVKEGDHLLTLEAMKMNTFVFVPQSGKVAEVKTAVGDAVEEGQILMTLQNL